MTSPNIVIIADYGIGDPTFAPGSSGHDDKFMEIFVRGGNAYRLFDNPSVEEEFVILEK